MRKRHERPRRRVAEGGIPIDPSVWRGLTLPRMSRRDLLRYTGIGAGAAGAAGVLGAAA
jgi:hypothetical protein